MSLFGPSRVSPTRLRRHTAAGDEYLHGDGHEQLMAVDSIHIQASNLSDQKQTNQVLNQI